MNTNFENLNNIGKHFKITGIFNKEVISKYYSAFFTDLNLWAQEITKKGYESETYPVIRPGNVCFIFKVYSQGQMSQFMYSQKIGAELILKGPLGPGLCLNKFSGNYVGFAGGTGLVPFLDLVYLI